MPNLFSQAIADITSTLNNGETGQRISALIFENTVGRFRIKQPSISFHSFYSIAIGAGNTFTVWTPAAGASIRLDGMMFQCTVVGRVKVQLDGSSLAEFDAQANVMYYIKSEYCSICHGTANGTLQIVNNSAVAIAFQGGAWGLELL